MALRFRRLGEVCGLLPRFLYSGIPNQKPFRMIPASFVDPLPLVWMEINGSTDERGCHFRSYSSGVQHCQREHECFPEEDFLNFIQSSLLELKGPSHCWLNKIEESKEPFSRDGTVLVILGGFVEDSLILNHDRVVMFERVKLLQQRYPKLQVFGFQSVSSFCSAAVQARIVSTIMKEYITFPILLSSKGFEMTNEACYVLFQGFRGPLHYHKKDMDLGVLVKVIEQLNVLQKVNSVMADNSSSAGVVASEPIKDPYACSLFRNLLLYFPACISVDEDGNRLFLSDTNHHRIIITDGNGKLLDCIGSSPGFEDGEFESSKLLRPAASFYDVEVDCLYFVDSENHAIRRANIESRVLETVYPSGNSEKGVGSLWSWILDKLGIKREADLKPEKFGMDSLVFPWHLMKSGENDLFIINRSFETLWIMSSATWEIKEVIEGFPHIMELCGQMITDKVSYLEKMLGNWSQQSLGSTYSIERLPYAELISSFATLQNNVIFCDPDGQRVLKYHRGSNDISNLQFSNYGMLGLPYWLAGPLERVLVRGDIYARPRNDHIQYFNVLPGRCDIRVNIDLPGGTQLAAPLQEGCIWRQARGSAVTVSGSEGLTASSEKVGVAQQWYDELDNLAFSNPGLDSGVEDEVKNLDINNQEENMAHINCAVNISPGSSEVIIYTLLYLKLNEVYSSCHGQDRRAAEKVLDISDHDQNGKQGVNACIELLLESCRDLREVVFMKPLHLRVRLECGDHPVLTTSKEIVSTHSSIDVNVSLD